MSVLAAFRSVVPDVRRHGHGLRTACARVLDRLAAGPLDNTVLGALGTPRPDTRTPGHPDARTRPDRQRAARGRPFGAALPRTRGPAPGRAPMVGE
ncbi:hypothetical protein [Kitasatospora sp. NPDC001547]|uniref:hypothetical protein n=1 Tax=Kitasatospora sp. NPDC001547 TaxID=3364015 RepID=UPI0036BDB604